MAFSCLLFTVLSLCVSCYATTEVPVFLWGDLARNSKGANPLETITTPNFNGILKEVLAEDAFKVIFIDKTLSVEDLSRKNTEGETFFPYLRDNLGDSLYLPSVNNPLHVLSDLANPEEVVHVKVTENGDSAEILSHTGKFLFINLEDAEEGDARADLLRRHNDFMEDVFTKLQEKHKKVIGVYTGRYPSWVVSEPHSRVRRQVESNSDDLNVNGLLLYVKLLQIQDPSGTTNLTGHPIAHSEVNDTEVETKRVKTMNTTLSYGDNSIVLNFREQAGYWFFDSVVTSDNVLYTTTEVYALTKFSYRCAQSVVFANNQTNVTFVDLQIQPYFSNTTNQNITYGDTFDCVGFFTAPIWASLMVTFILLAITFYGIMMMMDIRTMDRFDDPKGKTIAINTTD